MGLIRPDEVRRVEVDDGWIDVRASLSMREWLTLTEGQSITALSNPTPEVITGLLRVGVVAWSYPEEVTPENIDRLDVPTSMAVFAALNETVTDEKKSAQLAILKRNQWPPDLSYIAVIDRMGTDYHGFLDTPLTVVNDYLTVMEGEALASRKPEPVPEGVPPDAVEEIVTEVYEF